MIRAFHKKIIESSNNKQDALRFLKIKKRYEREANSLYCMLEKLEELKSASDTLMIQKRVVTATAYASKQISSMAMDSDKVQETMDQTREAIEKVNEVNDILSEQQEDPDLDAELQAMILSEPPKQSLPSFPTAPTSLPETPERELERLAMFA